MDFRILGPLEVWDGDHQLPVRGSKQRALLAVLLLHANEVVSTDRLIDLLWGDEPPEAGGAALRVRISQLRKALIEGGQCIVTQAPGYVLRVDDEYLDLSRFERLVAQAADASPEDAADQLRNALALWRGAPLAEFAYDDFAQAAIARLEELRITVLELRIEADLALGRHREVVPELEALVGASPLREGPRRQLMLALYRSGRQADALETYRDARRVLVDELGIEPTPALQEHEAAILRQDSALDITSAPVPERSILVAPVRDDRFESLVALAEPLARRPRRELIVAQLIGSAADLPRASALSRERRGLLQARGLSTRAAAFATESPGRDIVRIATEQDVDLVLLDASPELLGDVAVQEILVGAPCDVGLLVGGERGYEPGAVLVPFTGAEHDWSAVELAACLARAEGVPLRLAGPLESGRDASRLLASASLAVQRALGVDAEPLLVEQTEEGLLEAVGDASLVVVGLSDRWRRAGLGRLRHALVTSARVPSLIVRRGLRPGALAPGDDATRFTWSIAVH